MRAEIQVQVSEPYKVIVGSGAIQELSSHVPSNVSKIAVIHAAVMKTVAQNLSLPNGVSVDFFELPDSEAAKTAVVLTDIWEKLGAAGYTRSDLVISVGGGATTDLAGFVAATWLRGIRIIHIPSTLLAMVDAAVGGKTGINTSAGKNLVGAFHHPTAVICDLDLMQTLPLADFRGGLAEVVKCGFIADSKILELLADVGTSADLAKDSKIIEAASRAIAVKAAVVADDFTESKIGGLGREILNYGHTLGHAIENLENYKIRHGEAISIGMMFVAELSHLAGHLSELDLQVHRRLLTDLGLPVSYDLAAWESLLPVMAIDKKARGNQMRFVVLDALQKPMILHNPDLDLLKAAYQRIAS